MKFAIAYKDLDSLIYRELYMLLSTFLIDCGSY